MGPRGTDKQTRTVMIISGAIGLVLLLLIVLIGLKSVNKPHQVQFIEKVLKDRSKSPESVAIESYQAVPEGRYAKGFYIKYREGNSYGVRELHKKFFYTIEYDNKISLVHYADAKGDEYSDIFWYFQSINMKIADIYGKGQTPDAAPTQGPPVKERTVQSENFVIIPGRSAGPVILGRPISDEARKQFGTPTRSSDPSDSIDSGNCYWEGIVNAKLNDGTGKDNVFTLLIYDNRFKTERNIGIGSTLKEIQAAYHNVKLSKEDNIETGYVDLVAEIQGLTFYLDAEKNIVREIGLHAVK